MNKANFRVALMLGGNVGNTLYIFTQAKILLGESAGTIESVSEIYVSEPWGLDEQPAFMNQAILISTSLSPIELLSLTKAIELQLGRVKRELNGPREIDIDILLYEDFILKEDQLQIPHPRLHIRRFNLVPLAEIAPHWRHPVLKKTISELLLLCEDDLKVQKIA